MPTSWPSCTRSGRAATPAGVAASSLIAQAQDPSLLARETSSGSHCHFGLRPARLAGSGGHRAAAAYRDASSTTSHVTVFEWGRWQTACSTLTRSSARWKAALSRERFATAGSCPCRTIWSCRKARNGGRCGSLRWQTRWSAPARASLFAVAVSFSQPLGAVVSVGDMRGATVGARRAGH